MKQVMHAAFAGLLLVLPASAILRSVSLYLLGCGVITFACFGLDKFAAGRGSERLPERFLLLLALAGGALPAGLAMLCFRHKIRKPGFYLPIVIMIPVQAFLVWKYFLNR